MDIHGHTVPRKWRGSTPLDFNFQPIHFGESFTGAPCKWLLRSPRDTAPILLPFSKQNPPPLFRFPLPTGLHFVGFAFVREPRSLSPRSHFSFTTQHSKWLTNENENPNFSTAPRQFSSDFRIDGGFWSGATETEWSGLTVNVQLNAKRSTLCKNTRKLRGGHTPTSSL
ncbi:hypothetical protein AVEN_20490-1 [Araneus ventricosus]|uniref:Uncharacterized protein n=1 Tax=Araneus ventricosus TaxID=182803 RepID=A0A4Y2NG90_ARAVE|nr:hypothetical protein AVEN_31698-1 [Araneus ventricosus]GBN37208.1 hypothetical protein AVEN_20490-1 [Araneus ventricosus]